MKFSFKLFYIVCCTILFSSPLPSRAQNIVIVNGQPETCYWGCYGGLTTINVGFPNFGNGAQGGSGGSNSSAGYDDYTRGTHPAFNREPGCVREGMFYKEVVDKLKAGNPPGVVIMDTFHDPLFKNDPGWRKYHIEIRSHKLNQNNTYTIWRPQIHFMFNINTLQFTQVKMKNSYELGCVGVQRNEPII